MSQALPGNHYCLDHQGNGSYYAEHNCDLCKAQTKLAACREKADAEMERVKACEHIADGDDGWEVLRNLCPSTAAVSRLRDGFDACRGELEGARKDKDWGVLRTELYAAMPASKSNELIHEAFIRLSVLQTNTTPTQKDFALIRRALSTAVSDWRTWQEQATQNEQRRWEEQQAREAAERSLEQVRAATIEECAKLCEANKLLSGSLGPLMDAGWDFCQRVCASAIRALSTQPQQPERKF